MNVGVVFRELLPPNVAEELETMSARIRQSWFVEHDADGHHGNLTTQTIYSAGLIAAGSDPLQGTATTFAKKLRVIHLSNSSSGSETVGSALIQQLVATVGSAQGLGSAARAAHSSGIVTLIIGGGGGASVIGNGSASNARGLQATVHTESGSGGITDARAVYAAIPGRISGTGTITNAYGVYVDFPGGAGITNKFGVFVADTAAVSQVPQITLADGSEATPSLRFISDTDTGLFRVGGDRLGFATGGTQRFEINASGQLVGSSSLNGSLFHTLTNTSNGGSALSALGLFNDAGASLQLILGGSGFVGVANTSFVSASNELVIRTAGSFPMSFQTNFSETLRFLTTRHSVFPELTTDPALASLAANAAVAMYTKNNKLVFAYNNAGTVTYLSIPLNGSATTWTHNTTAP